MDVIDITSSDSENEKDQSKLHLRASSDGLDKYLNPCGQNLDMGIESIDHSNDMEGRIPASYTEFNGRMHQLDASVANNGTRELEYFESPSQTTNFDDFEKLFSSDSEFEESGTNDVRERLLQILGNNLYSGQEYSTYYPKYQQENAPTFSASNFDPLVQHNSKRTLPPSLQLNELKTMTSASNIKSTDQFHNVPARQDESGAASTSRKNYGKHDLDDNNDCRIINSITVNGNYTRSFETSSVAAVVTRDHNKDGSHRVLPSWTSGKSVSERHPANFQPVDLNGSREYPRVGEQTHSQTDERLVFEVALQDLAQPKFEVDLPSGLLSVSLLRHQKIALAWMDQKEICGLPCSGGILADDQGLGKTVSMIALIQKQIHQQRKFTASSSNGITVLETLNLDEDDNAVPQAGKTEQNEETDHLKSSSMTRPSLTCTSTSISATGRPAAGTLVVCPASVLRQWAHELNDKVASDSKLSVLIYHGGTRTKHPVELAKFDVVLTTYAIVTNEVPKKPLAGDDEGEKRNHQDYLLSPELSSDKKRKATSDYIRKKKGKGLLLHLDGGALAGVRWFRVILDEAQIIKNHRTQVARACCGLRAKRRWCLSGTPMQNAIDDIYSYFRFLRYEPYAVYPSFCSAIKAPILRNADTGYKKLQAVLKAVMLRRTKGTILDGKPILKLPPKSILLKKLSFSLEERSFYTGLEADFRERFKRYAAEGTVKQNYANILLMLLRLRQACDHPLLVKDYQSNSACQTSVDSAKKLSEEKLKRFLGQLEDSLPICGLCNDPPEEAVITICGHIFCYQCVSESIASGENLCPALGCGNTLSDDLIFSKGTLKSCMPNVRENVVFAINPSISEDSGHWQNGFMSSKISAAMEILKSIRDSCTVNLEFSPQGPSLCIPPDESHEYISCVDPKATNGVLDPSEIQTKVPSKAIVFSQWTNMLDLMENSLNHCLIQYRRLDGSMTLASREQAVKDFYADPEVTVMLMSLKAGNLGLNMIVASHVILFDLWWNPTSEDQAIDRAHRIGQTKSVTVHRLTIEDTVEERILKLQEKKREMVSSAFGEDPSGRAGTRLTVEDLRYLFQV